MLGGFCLWIHESTHFFLQATWRDLTLIPPSKYSESSEKLKAPYFFPSKKKCSTLSLLFSFIYPQPSKALRFPWPTPIHLLAPRTLVSIHHKLSDHLEKLGRLVGRGEYFSGTTGFCVKRLDPETQNPSEFTTATPWVNPNSNALESWQGICVERGSVYRKKFPYVSIITEIIYELWYMFNFNSTRFYKHQLHAMSMGLFDKLQLRRCPSAPDGHPCDHHPRMASISLRCLELLWHSGFMSCHCHTKNDEKPKHPPSLHM